MRCHTTTGTFFVTTLLSRLLQRKISMKADGFVAEALLNLGSSTRCPLCSELFYVGEESYDFYSLQCHPRSRKLVRAGRKHCLEKHPDKWVWNFIKKDSLVAVKSEEKVDALVCLGLSMASKLFPLTPGLPLSFYDTEELLYLWTARIMGARAWLQLGLPRRPELVLIFKDCVGMAEGRLDYLGRNRKRLLQALEKEDEPGRINHLQLLCYTRNLHKTML